MPGTGNKYQIYMFYYVTDTKAFGAEVAAEYAEDSLPPWGLRFEALASGNDSPCRQQPWGIT